MKKYIEHFLILEKLFGGDYAISKKPTPNFPYIYTQNFGIYGVDGAFGFIFIVPTDASVSYDLIKGIYYKCLDSFNKKVVVYLHNSSESYKDIFKRSMVSFIASDGEYRFFDGDGNLPSIDYDVIRHESYTKKTQMIVNFYLSSDVREYSVREIASRCGFSSSSVSRANAFLHEIGAVEKHGTGNMAKYKIVSKADFLNRVKPHLIYPIKERKAQMVDKDILTRIAGFLSGENALCRYSNLELENDFLEIAVSPEVFDGFEHRANTENQAVCYLEEFIYDASIFARGDCISPLDAYIIALKRYNGNDDPRIKKAIKNLEKVVVNTIGID